MSMVEVVVGKILDRFIPPRFEYSLLVGGVRTGLQAWVFSFDYANAISRPVILEEAILKFSFVSPGAWEPVARTRRFEDNRHFGPYEKRDSLVRSMGVRVLTDDIEFPDELQSLRDEPEAVSLILSQTNHVEIGLRVRVGRQVHQTNWHPYGTYDRQSRMEDVQRALRRLRNRPCPVLWSGNPEARVAHETHTDQSQRHENKIKQIPRSARNDSVVRSRI